MSVELAWVGLGSNLAQPARQLRQALHLLSVRPDLELLAVSPFYRSAAITAPGDDAAQPDYCNAVAALRTALTPEQLLQVLLTVEQTQGRLRSAEKRWQPRTLDLDLLACGLARRQGELLQLPHPQLAFRHFVIRPWHDLAPSWQLPDGGLIRQLNKQLATADLCLWSAG